MAYALGSHLVDLFGLEELIQLTNSGEENFDVVKVDAALSDASDFADGFLRGRYQMPITQASSVLTRIVCAIARYYLSTGGDRYATEQVENEYKSAKKKLEQIGKGALDLGFSAIKATDSGADIAFASNGRVHTQKRLKDY